MKKIILFMLLALTLFSQEKFKVGIASTATELKEVIDFQNAFNLTMKTLGYDVEYISLPNLRSLNDVNNGNLDGDLPRTKAVLLNNENIFLVDVSLSKQKFYVYSKDKKSYTNYKSLENKKIGLTFGSTISKQLIQKNVKKFEINELKEVESMKNMLISGRDDLLFLPEAIGSALLEKYPKANIKKSDEIFETIDFYLVLNEKHLNIKKRIEDELKKQLSLKK